MYVENPGHSSSFLVFPLLTLLFHLAIPVYLLVYIFTRQGVAFHFGDRAAASHFVRWARPLSHAHDFVTLSILDVHLCGGGDLPPQSHHRRDIVHHSTFHYYQSIPINMRICSILLFFLRTLVTAQNFDSNSLPGGEILNFFLNFPLVSNFSFYD